VVVELTDIPNELATRRPVPLALASIKRRFLGPRGVKSHVPQRTAGYLGLIADFLDQAMVTNWPFRITKYVLTYLNSMLEFQQQSVRFPMPSARKIDVAAPYCRPVCLARQ
jgi:hypothetical protein